MKQMNKPKWLVCVLVVAVVALLALLGRPQPTEARAGAVTYFDNGVFHGSINQTRDSFGVRFWPDQDVENLRCFWIDVRNDNGKRIGAMPCEKSFLPDKDNPDREGKWFPRGVVVSMDPVGITDPRNHSLAKPFLRLRDLPQENYWSPGTGTDQAGSFLRGDETPASLVIVYTVGSPIGSHMKATANFDSISTQIKEWQASYGEAEMPSFAFDPETMTAVAISRAGVQCIGRDCGKRPAPAK